MLNQFGLLLLIASLNIAHSGVILPQVFIPEIKLYPQNPPKLPVICLSEPNFTLPQFCQNASEWEDVDMSIKILTDYTESDPERSTFASFINLIKFILIKEELDGIDAMTGPIIEVERPEGKIFKENSDKPRYKTIQLCDNVDDKPRYKTIQFCDNVDDKPRYKTIQFCDNVDIPNIIPICKRRSSRRKNIANAIPIVKAMKANSTCPCKIPKTLSPVFLGGMSPMPKFIKPCPCSNCPYYNLQSLPCTNVKPGIGCGGNCNMCQRMSSPLMAGSVIAGCPQLSSSVLAGTPQLNSILAGTPQLNSILANYQNLASSLITNPKLAGAQYMSGCPKTMGDALLGYPQTNMFMGGCPRSNPMLGCPGCSRNFRGCQAKPSVQVIETEAIPMIDCYGNLMKQVKTTVLVPFTTSQILV